MDLEAELEEFEAAGFSLDDDLFMNLLSDSEAVIAPTIDIRQVLKNSDVHRMPPNNINKLYQTRGQQGFDVKPVKLGLQKRDPYSEYPKVAALNNVGLGLSNLNIY